MNIVITEAQAAVLFSNLRMIAESFERLAISENRVMTFEEEMVFSSLACIHAQIDDLRNDNNAKEARKQLDDLERQYKIDAVRKMLNN